MKRIVLVGACFIAASIQAQSQTTPVQTVFTDPFEYCKTFGSVDRPGARYKGPEVVAEIAAALRVQPNEYPQVSWRCMNGALLACVAGNSPDVCSKAAWLRDPRPKPTAPIHEHCRTQPDDETIPETNAVWSCQGGVPIIRENQYKVDARGFSPGVWKRVSPSVPGPSQAAQQLQPSIASVQPSAVPSNPTECNFRDSLAQEIFATSERAARIAADAEPILKSLDVITAKAQKADVPLGKQLSSVDITNFESLRQKLMTPQVAALLERRKLRDLEVVRKMVALADQSFRYGVEPTENEPDSRILSSLRLIRAALEQKPLQIAPPSNDCGVDGAIFSLQNEIISKIGMLNLAEVNRLAEQLRTKYKMQDRIDRERLGSADQKNWDTAVKNIVIPSERAKIFVLDLEAGRVALRSSNIIYVSDQEDARTNNGNLEALGLSIKRRVESNEFDQATLTAIAIWRVLNESDLAK